MTSRILCDFCAAPLEHSREFIYHFESLQFCDDEASLEAIRRSAKYFGEPLRICHRCNKSYLANKQALEAEREAAIVSLRRRYKFTKISLATLLIASLLYWVVTRSY